MTLLRHVGYSLAITTASFGSAALGDTTNGPSDVVSLELNAADIVGETCRLTFVVTNKTDVQIDKAIYETVLFSSTGTVMMLTLFDFGILPTAVPRVRQFQIPDTSCDGIGSILINGTNSCQSNGVDSDVCSAGLKPSSRIAIKLQG